MINPDKETYQLRIASPVHSLKPRSTAHLREQILRKRELGMDINKSLQILERWLTYISSYIICGERNNNNKFVLSVVCWETCLGNVYELRPRTKARK